jgi:hypothetical protein
MPHKSAIASADVTAAFTLDARKNDRTTSNWEDDAGGPINTVGS